MKARDQGKQEKATWKSGSRKQITKQLSVIFSDKSRCSIHEICAEKEHSGKRFKSK